MPSPLSGHPTQPRSEDDRHAPADVGEEPDPRFTFANERTFLAWNRTALALVATGTAGAAFLETDLQGARLLIALPLIVMGAVVALSSYRRWERVERAMRLSEPIPYSSLPRILALAVAVLSAVIGALVALDLVK